MVDGGKKMSIPSYKLTQPIKPEPRWGVIFFLLVSILFLIEHLWIPAAVAYVIGIIIGYKTRRVE